MNKLTQEFVLVDALIVNYLQGHNQSANKQVVDDFLLDGGGRG